MRRHIGWFAIALTLCATRAFATLPYPSNPRPCSAPGIPASCIDDLAYADYLFLPTTTPPTRPIDFNNDWKTTSDKTGDPTIDNNPQELFGVKGGSVDLAWQVTTGRPDVLIAVLDSGIRWQDQLPDIVNKFYLNRGELPVPEGSTNTRDPWDRNNDTLFNMRDYLADATHVQDSRVSDQNGNGVIDPEDLIFLFSNGVDEDNNGYIDDISGWDFYEDDNDALDEVRYGHGTGEAHDSTAEADNGGDVGTCPNCRVLMVRVGDSFVTEINNFAEGVIFGVDSGASVIQEALGTLNQSSFGQAAVDYAYNHGVAVIASAADEESGHHNYPANYEHTIEVNSVTHFADLAGMQQSPKSYLLLNGCTNYSPHIAVSVASGACSSEATGKGAGVAALLYSAARNEVDRGNLTKYRRDDGSLADFVLSANEVKQLFTMSADDINFDARPDLDPPLPQNYSLDSPYPGVVSSSRFPSIEGFDQYFGYGRMNANSAVRRVVNGKIPPEAAIDSPRWFQTIAGGDSIEVHGRVAANRAASYTYLVDVAPGVQPKANDFEPVGTMSANQTQALTGTLATIPLAALIARMPHGIEGVAVDANGRPDPDRFTVTVRVRVVDSHGNAGEDRKAFFLHRDADLVTDEPVYLGSDGAASPVFADLDGDGVDDLIVATSDGIVHAFRTRSLTELPGWPVHTNLREIHTGSRAYAAGVSSSVYSSILGSPAVGDLDRDGRMEVVANDLQGHVYVWDTQGVRRPGFPVSTIADYSYSHRSERDLGTPTGRVPDLTNRHNIDNRLGRGFGCGPVLANLDGSADGSLEILAGSADRHLYAWHNNGDPVHGWPVMLRDPAKVASVDPITNELVLNANAKQAYGTKIIVPPSVGDIDGDGKLDVVAAVNEEYRERPNAFFDSLLIQLFQAGGLLESGNGRLYAINNDGVAHGSHPIDRGWNPDAFKPGWPVKVAMLTTELLPTVGSGINGSPALADLNGDGKPEIGVFAFLGPAYVWNGDGTSFLGKTGTNLPITLGAQNFGPGSPSTDIPAYPGLGGGVFAEMNGAGQGFQFVAPSAGLGQALDANLPGKQYPSDNLVGVWDVTNADGSLASLKFRPAFPRLAADQQFLSSPSVADISGDGFPETLSGSGIYDVNAYDRDGISPAGWPKFTGGWTVTTPATGDIDGDGKRDVASLTREGNLFVWTTRGDACGAAPWPQYHHDATSTGNYATDAVAPMGLKNAQLLSTIGSGEDISLRLVGVPGDDGYCGPVATFDVRFSPNPIVDQAQFQAAAHASASMLPTTAGRDQVATVNFNLTHAGHPSTVYVAGRTMDGSGNASEIVSFGTVAIEGPTLTATRTNTQVATPTPPPTASPTIVDHVPPTMTSTRTHTVAPTNTAQQPTATRVPSHDNGGCQVAPVGSGNAVWLLVGLVGLVRRRRGR